MEEIKRFIPKPVKIFLNKIYLILIDTFEAIKGRNSMTPPRSLNFVGGGDFIRIGEEFKKYFLEICNLQPNHRVLDVGSGNGRMAVPLTSYLSNDGEYWGFDIVKKGINWCEKHISIKYPNFHFQLADIQNKYYNPKGKYKSTEYKFPYKSEYFDFIFLTSVFTHMFPRDVENYLKEIARVLKTKGICLITFFLLNDESEGHIRKGISSQKFIYDITGCLTTDKDNPESAIAYKEDLIRGLFKKNQLSISDPIQYGSWCGRTNYLSYQDIVIAIKQ